jgi:hypothetical protein
VQDIWHHSSPNLISPAFKDVPDQKCGHGWSQHQFNWEPCFLSTFKYVDSEAGAVSSLRRMAASLRPGGLLLLGLHLTDYKNSPPDHERWIGRKPGIRVVSDTWSAPADRKSRTEAMRTRMRITEKGKTRIEETLWDFRTYSPAELKALLAKVPSLHLVACHDFHYDLSSTRKIDMAYSDVLLVLRKA